MSKGHRHSRCQQDPGGHSREFPGTITAKALPGRAWGSPVPGAGYLTLVVGWQDLLVIPYFFPVVLPGPAAQGDAEDQGLALLFPHPQHVFPSIPCLLQPLWLHSCGHNSCKDNNCPEARFPSGLFAYSRWACFSLCLQPANSTQCLLTRYHRILPCWQALLPAPSHFPESQPSFLLPRPIEGISHVPSQLLHISH